MNAAKYFSIEGGLPSQTELLTGRAVFTEAYAVIPKGVMRDIVTSCFPFWENTRAWILARPLSGFAETFSQYVMEVAPGGLEPDYAGRARDDLSGFALPDAAVREADGIVMLSTPGGLSARVRLDPFGVEWFRAGEDRPFLQDRPTQAYFVSRQSHELRHFMARDPAERHYGLGDKSGPLDRTGRRFKIDAVAARGANVFAGGPGSNDAFLLKLSPAGDQLLHATYLGGSGNDQISGGNANEALSGGSGNDTLSGIETVIGSAQGDTLTTTTTGTSTLDGGTGNDTLCGLGGFDTFDGGADTDVAVINISTVGTNGYTASGDNQTLLTGAPRQWFVTLRRGF